MTNPKQTPPKQHKHSAMRPSRVSPMQQLMFMFRNREERFVVSAALASLDGQAQEDIALAMVAYLRFGIRRREFGNPFLLALFDNLVTYLDFTRGKEHTIPTTAFPSPVVALMAQWYTLNPDETVMFDDNTQHRHTYQDLIDCYPELEKAIAREGHKPTDLVEYPFE